MAPLFFAGMIALVSIPAHADRVILTPAPSSLAPGQYSGEAVFGVDRHQARNAQWLGGTAGIVELEASHFYLSRRQGSALSLSSAILPETNATPSLAVGVRDLLGTARHFGEYGYSGRNVYLAVGKTFPNGDKLAFPLRNLGVTAGVGTGERAGVVRQRVRRSGIGLSADSGVRRARAELPAGLSAGVGNRASGIRPFAWTQHGGIVADFSGALVVY